MNTLRRLFHYVLDTGGFLLILALALVTSFVLIGLPLLVCWIAIEMYSVVQRPCEQESLASRMAEEDAQEFAEFYGDLWQIGKQYDPPAQFNSIEARRLFQFARSFEAGEDDTCIGHVDAEEEAS